ncbi:autophagy protein Apg5-domain-containing protein [Lipomyces chichibuensis]|uniref:autophagy protein Apg5-domain-containing protein n=1 Tax=Lipomyces chichibuensis TaxID=1546026 RepID=UPI0033437848
MSISSPSFAPSLLRRKVWDGVIPLQIILAPDECRILDSVEPFYINAARVSYLPQYFGRITAYFKPSLRDAETSLSSEWWLDFEGVPLRWNWPVGLLYDLLTGLDPTQADNQDHDWHLPWTLVLHHSQYPSDTLLRITSAGAVKEYWVNRVKEADFIRRGNANAVMSLSKTDSDEMWAGVEEHDFDKFWGVTKKLLSSDPYALRHVPIKIYLPSSNKMLQALVPPSISPREFHTVGTALHAHLPQLFPSRRTCLLARPVLHGVLLSMAIPLAELLYECMYTDGYLHICIIMIS